MPTVARLNVAPMKGTALHHPDEIRLEPFGVPGNRRFFLVDPAGKRISATRHGSLMKVRADHDPEIGELTLSFPDGSAASGPAAPGDGLTVDFWGRDVQAHLVPGPFDEPLSTYLDEPVRLARCDREGDGNDVRAVTIVSTESVRELARQGAHQGELDAGRFRMTIELDGCEPHEEDTWEGRDVRIGETLLHVGEPVPRCIVTTWDPNTGEKDFETLKVIRAYRERNEDGLPFGVYAEVAEPGDVRVGDTAEPA